MEAGKIILGVIVKAAVGAVVGTIVAHYTRTHIIPKIDQMSKS